MGRTMRYEASCRRLQPQQFKDLEKGKGLKNRALQICKNIIFVDFFDPHNLAKTGVWQKTVITTRSGVKKYAGWCTRIPKSSSDDPFFALFHFLGIFLIRLFVVPRQYKIWKLSANVEAQAIVVPCPRISDTVPTSNPVAG